MNASRDSPPQAMTSGLPPMDVLKLVLAAVLIALAFFLQA